MFLAQHFHLTHFHPLETTYFLISAFKVNPNKRESFLTCQEVYAFVFQRDLFATKRPYFTHSCLHTLEVRCNSFTYIQQLEQQYQFRVALQGNYSWNVLDVNIITTNYHTRDVYIRICRAGIPDHATSPHQYFRIPAASVKKTKSLPICRYFVIELHDRCF